MNFALVKKLIRKAKTEAEDEALKAGVDVTSDSFRAILATLEQKLLSEMQIPEGEYQDYVNKLKDIGREKYLKSRVELPKELADRISQKMESLANPTYASLPDKPSLLTPRIVQELIKEALATLPKPKEKQPLIKIERPINQTIIQREEFDATPLLKEMDKKISDIKIPDLEKFKEELRPEWDSSLKESIRIANSNKVEMPDFRKLAMGLQQGIDEAKAMAAAAEASDVDSFNGRIGTVLPTAGDYTFAQIGSTPTTLGGYGITDAYTKTASDARYEVPLTFSTGLNRTVNTITVTSAPILSTGRTISITGDLAYTSPSFDGSGNVTAAGTLATVNTNTGSWGSATQVSQFTVNGKGLITAVANVTITPAASSITGGAALTKTDDTNVTLTLGGTPASALLAASSLTLGWTGTLSTARGGTGNGTGTATINANLTGPITSVGNATSIASQTGTGTKFVVDNSPTLITPVLGVASATTLNKLTITTPATGSTLTIIDGKTLTINKTISLTAADDTGVYTLPTGTKTLVDTTVTTLSSLALPESQLTFTDITTNNASTTKHGFLLKLNNTATQYMNGTGAWSTPPDTTYTGTTNQVVVTGTVLSLPQSINTGATVQFGSIGIGTGSVPAWSSNYKILGINTAGFSVAGGNSSSVDGNFIADNGSFNGTNWKYVTSNAASLIGHSGGAIDLRVAASGTAGNNITWTVAMYIDNSGNVGLGTTSPSSFGAFAIRRGISVSGVTGSVSGEFSDAAQNSFYIAHPSGYVNLTTDSDLGFSSGTTLWMRIKAAGVIQMQHYGAGTATFDASGNISSVSDERLKDIQGDFKAGLKEVLNLNPILYKWNEKSGNETKEVYPGFSAQNVKEFIPEAVGENPDGYLSLQDRGIIAALVNGMKEQQKTIEDLKIKIEEQKK